MKKKILTVLLGLLVAASAVFASGKQEGTAKEDMQPVKITFQTRSHGAGAKYEADIVNAFAESHPNIDVELVQGQWTQYDAKLRLTVMSGDPPNMGSVFTHKLGELYKYLTPLDDSPVGNLLEKGGINSADFDKLAWVDSQFNGKQYSVPAFVPGLLMWYNRKLFSEVGLDPDNFPDTMEDFVDTSNRIRDAGHYAYHTGANGPPRYFRRAWYVYFWQQGGELFDENYTKATFNNKEGLRALQFMVDMIHKYKWNVAGSDGYKQFKAGDLGILYAGNWFIAAALESDIDWFGAKVPIFFDKRYTWANVTSYMIPKQPKGTPERVYMACMELLNYYNENFWKRTLKTGHPSAYIPSQEHPEIRKSEYWTKAGKHLAEMYNTEAAHYPVEHPKGSELEAAIQSNIELAVNGEITPQEALKRAEQECNAILKK